MRDKKRIEILSKVIKRVYKNPEMQALIDKSMIDVYKEDGVPP